MSTATPALLDSMTELWRGLERAWEAADGAAFGSHFTDQVAFVTLTGAVLNSNTDVGSRHGELFEGVFADTTLSTEVEYAEVLAPGVVLVHATSSVLPAGPTTHAQAVVVHDLTQRPGWRIRAFHNTATS